MLFCNRTKPVPGLCRAAGMFYMVLCCLRNLCSLPGIRDKVFYDWHGRVILRFTVHYIFQHGVYIFFPGSSELKTLQLMKPVIHEGSVLWWKEDRPHNPKRYSDRSRNLSDASPPHRASASVYTWKQLTFFVILTKQCFYNIDWETGDVIPPINLKYTGN